MVLSLPLLFCESSVSVKENTDKKNKNQRLVIDTGTKDIHILML